MAAKQGARLVLNGRNADALDSLCKEIDGSGTTVVGVPGDVASQADMFALASEALSGFGNFDTWVNNAGVSIYGRLEEVSQENSRQLFETNFLGTGKWFADSRTKSEKINCGAIINVRSTSLIEQSNPGHVLCFETRCQRPHGRTSDGA